MIHIIKGFSIVSEADVDFFFSWSSLAFSMDVGNLISGSSALSKSGLNIWKFSVSSTVEATGLCQKGEFISLINEMVRVRGACKHG